MPEDIFFLVLLDVCFVYTIESKGNLGLAISTATCLLLSVCINIGLRSTIFKAQKLSQNRTAYLR